MSFHLMKSTLPFAITIALIAIFYSCKPSQQPDTIACGATDLPSTIDPITYTCDNKETILVMYDNDYSQGKYSLNRAFVKRDKNYVEYAQVISGSGAKYESSTHRWWTKGNGAFLEEIATEKIICNCTSE